MARLNTGGDDGWEGDAVEFREHYDWSEPINWKERIVINPIVLIGKPIIRGTRMAVEFIVELFAEGWTHEQILSNYPQLDDVQAALRYASEMLKQEKSASPFGLIGSSIIFRNIPTDGEVFGE